ncbi:MAG: discoidin domain-containing protein [Sedimentisphaerales bacterium]|nr:discoidin domain-containing protein [Sedimentisphaerales bacterium]
MALLILVLGLAAGVTDAGIKDGLVGYYPLDEGAGDVAHDMSGAGHDGTLHNGMTWISPAYLRGGVNCDGTADTRIELGTWNPAEGTGQLSLALWIRWAGGGGTYQGLIGKRDLWPDTTMFQFQVRPENGGTFRLETGSVAIVSPGNTLNPLVQTWVHVAATFDGTTARLYLDGQEVASGAFSFYAAGEGSNMGIGCVTGGGAGYSGNTEVFSGDMDEVCIYNRSLSVEEVTLVMAGLGGDTASNPSPEDKATDVPRDAVLSWEPVETATTRDVYFGTVYEDVNDASSTDGRDVLVSPGQTATTYDPDGLLEYGQTYYWRIDEVNAPPDGTIFQGDTWSFTAEPYAYPIEYITAVASSQQSVASGPIKTIDGSGLDPDDQHSDDMTHMWMSAGVPAWVEYTFDKEYKLDELWVWNANSQLETYMNFGAKDVTIEYSTDGEIWVALENVPEFAKGTGLPGYAANTVVDFGGVTARHVRLTINATWGNPMAASLSELRFLYVPVQARQPEPADGATDVSLATDLTWRPGREAQSHDVYFDGDAEAVAQGTVAPATSTGPSYTPASMEFGTTYYWRVDEVGETGTYEGNLWSFTTTEYRMIDDFEAYTNDSPDRVFQTWVDGLGFSPDDSFPNGYAGNGTGAIVGYDPALGDIMEMVIAHGGQQSMPVSYDNSLTPFYSETEREFATAQNWTANGADTLALHIRGNASGFAETAGGQIIMNAIGTDIWDTADEFRYAYKNLSGNGSMVVRVDSMVRTDGWAKAGVMIRESLHPGSKHAFVCLTPDYGMSFQQRPETGNVMSQVSTNVVAASGWVKLTRTGNVFTAQESADGVTWTDVTFTAPVDVSMASDVLIGLAVTSHNANAVTAAEFSNLSTTGNVTGQWQIAEIGVEQPVGNVAEPIYVRIEDSTGGGATIVNADEAMALRSAWREWIIPYSDLTGVDLSRVRKMVIGVGSKSAPTAGGAGLVYVDDIAIGRPVAE